MLKIIFKWSLTKTRRLVDAYPDFQSVSRTHRLQPVVVEFRVDLGQTGLLFFSVLITVFLLIPNTRPRITDAAAIVAISTTCRLTPGYRPYSDSQDEMSWLNTLHAGIDNQASRYF